MVPPVRSPRSTAVCEDLSPFVCELRKRSKIVPKVTRGNSRPGTPALPRNTAVSEIQQQPRAASWGRVEYMSDPARGLLLTLAFSGHVATPRLLGASGCQFDSGEDRTINKNPTRVNGQRAPSPLTEYRMPPAPPQTLTPSPTATLSAPQPARLCAESTYTRAMPPIRPAPTGATVSHAFSAGSYRSTELRRPSAESPPPAAP